MVLHTPQQQQLIGAIPTTSFAESAGDEDDDVQLFDEQLLTDPVSAARATIADVDAAFSPSTIAAGISSGPSTCGRNSKRSNGNSNRNTDKASSTTTPATPVSTERQRVSQRTSLSRQALTERSAGSSHRTSTSATITPRDVLFGRGRSTREHDGNLRCAHLVEMHQPEYEHCSKSEKTDLAMRIVFMIKECDGRFLKKDRKTGWEEVEDTKAREKVSHFFRNLRATTLTNDQDDNGQDIQQAISHRSSSNRQSSTEQKSGSQRTNTSRRQASTNATTATTTATDTQETDTKWVEEPGNRKHSLSGPMFPTKELFSAHKNISASSINKSSSFSDAATRSSSNNNINSCTGTSSNTNSCAINPIATNSNSNSNSNSTTLNFGNYDIVCGRHSGAYNSIGNRRFRVTIDMNLQRYIAAPTPQAKTNVIQAIVRMLHDNIGARFLKKTLVKVSDPICGGNKKIARYTVMTEKQAREKVGHALRDLVNPARSSTAPVAASDASQRSSSGVTTTTKMMMTTTAAATASQTDTNLTNTAATAAPPPSVFILPSTASTPLENIVRFAGTTTEPTTTPPPCSTLSLSSSSSHSSTAVKSAVTASDTDTTKTKTATIKKKVATKKKTATIKKKVATKKKITASQGSARPRWQKQKSANASFCNDSLAMPAADAVTASDTDTDTDTDTTTRQIKTYFFDQAAILPSSLPNGLVTIPEKLRHLFDRVASHKLKMMFPNKPQEEINQVLAEIWKRLCNEKLSEVLNLQVQRYKAHEELRKIEWKKQKPNKKYEPDRTDSRMIGLVCDSPTNPKFETITSIWNKGFDPYKNLQADLVTAMYNSALPIGSDVTDFDHTKIVHILHFPGEINTQKCVEKGMLWKAKNGAIGEPCLRYPIAKWAKLAALLGIEADPTAISNAFRGCVAFYDICPIIAFNKCGGSHNNATIRDYMTTILVEFVKRCRNITHINVYGADPRVYVQKILKPMLESQVKNNLTFTFNNHPASFMRGGAKLDECKSFCKTGLVNLSLALNLDPKTVANYQARINSDDDLVTTVVKATTPAELERVREMGKKYSPINSRKRVIFTANDDKLLATYDYMFSLNNYKKKWERISMMMSSVKRSFKPEQCRNRMDTLLQRNHGGLINSPTSLQRQLQKRKPLVTSYWRKPTAE